MSPRQAQAVLVEAARRAEAQRRVDFGKLCFPKQRAFVEDDSPFVAGLCGRRGGKSDGAVLKCLRSAQRNPGAVVPYIALSRPHAKRIAWPKLLLWNRRLALGCRFNHADLTMTFPKTGSQIVLGGANDESEIERYRGGAYPTVVIDEAQAFRSFLPRFIIEVLMPAILDYDGQIVLIGTPAPHPFGFFHDISNAEGRRTIMRNVELPEFNVHRWTGFDNPNLDRDYREGRHEDVEKALAVTAGKIDALSKAAGIKPGDPPYEREWKAVWSKDSSGLVYRVPDLCLIDTLPEADDFRYVLGMDVGFVDATAFVVFAYSPSIGRAFVVESFQKTEMLPSHQAAMVMRLDETYDFESIVIDPGGGGKGLVEELSQRHGVPAKVAEKREKVAAIETLNGDLRANVLNIVERGNEELLHDLGNLKWDYTRLERKGGANWEMKPITHLAIDDSTPDHLADAFLYGHRECLHYLNEYDVESPKHGTPEWLAAEEERLLEMALSRFVEGEEKPWWEQGPDA